MNRSGPPDEAPVLGVPEGHVSPDVGGVPPPSLAEAAISGARSFAQSRVVVEIILFSSVLALARLINPAQQGRAAVALVFPVIAAVFVFEGFGAVLVTGPEPSLADQRTAMTMSVVTGTLLSIATAAGAETVGRSWVGGQTADLIAITAPTFLIASTTCVSRARLARNLGFRRMSRNDMIATALGTGIIVLLAALGLEARALIYGAVISTIIDAMLQFSYARPVWPGWSRASARRVFAFGSWASLNGLILILLTNVDYLILGLTLRPRLVGIYYRSYAFGVQYQGKLTAVMMQMVFPLMARAETASELRRVRERTVEMNAVVALPFLGLLVVLAPKLIPIMYGARWHDAIRPTQILAVAGMAVAVNVGALGPALALGRTRRLALVSAGTLILYAAAIYFATPFGLITVCISAAAAHVVMLLICQRYLIDKVIGLPMTQIVTDVGPAVVSTAAAILVAGAVNRELVALVPGYVDIVVIAPLGLATYALALRLAFPERAKRLSRVMHHVLRRSSSIA